MADARLRAAAALLVALGLWGCAGVSSAPAPGFSAAERAEWQARFSDEQWDRANLPDDLRPAVPMVVYGSNSERESAWVTCMNAAFLESGVAESESSPGALWYPIADFTCSVAFQVIDEESGLLNGAQADYWYDYYANQLVPCLAARGFLVEGAPTRAEFVDDYGQWNPYYALPKGTITRLFGRLLDSDPTGILQSCPAAPPGLEGPEQLPSD